MEEKEKKNLFFISIKIYLMLFIDNILFQDNFIIYNTYRTTEKIKYTWIKFLIIIEFLQIIYEKN